MTTPEIASPTKRSSRRRQVTTDPVEPTTPPVAEVPESPASVSPAPPPAGAGAPPPSAPPTTEPAPVPMPALSPPPPPGPFGGFTPTTQNRLPSMPTPAPAPASHGAFTPLPPPGPCFPGTDFRRFDVVQILEPESRLYGMFLVIGDILGDKVHGYYFAEGKQRQFATVRMQFCWPCGTSRVRFQNPCSPKWISDNRPSSSQ
jgi:hypothetical protein